MASTGQVAFFTTPPTVDGDSNLFWDNTSGIKALRLGTESWLTEISGDLWISCGAYYDGANWKRSADQKFAFALNLRGNNIVPNEDQGVVLWRATKGAINSVITWDLGFDLTAFRDFIIGGFGIEVDGNGIAVKPYGRFLNNYDDVSTIHQIGMMSNVFLDLRNPGRDLATRESWFAGFQDDISKIRRIAPNVSLPSAPPMSTDPPPVLPWSDFITINTNGDVGMGLGTATAPTLTASATGGSLVTGTYY